MISDEQSIRELIHTWLRASADNQLDKILSLMTDDVIFLRQGQTPMRGKQAFAEAFATVMGKFKTETHSEVAEIHIDGNLAYCLSHLQITMTPISIGASSIHLAGPILSVLRKQADGKWLISRDANMLSPQK